MNQWYILMLILSVSALSTSYSQDFPSPVHEMEIDILKEKLTRLVLSPMLNKMKELDSKLEHILALTGTCTQATQDTSVDAIRYLGQQILDLNFNLLNSTQQLMLKEDSIIRNLTKLALHQRLYFEAVNPNFGPLLISAAKNGDKEDVVGLLELEAPIEFTDSENNAPIHKATQNITTEILKILLEHGADVNSHGKGGRTPLHLASENGCVECARILLGKGALVDSRDAWKDTPLIKSAKYGHEDLVKLLLENGADVNAVQETDYSALHMASREGHANIVAILLDHGADLSLKTEWKFTALDFAIAKEHDEIVSYLKNQMRLLV